MRAAVLGAPIAHSLSPVLHRAAYRALGLTGWSYEAIECDERRLPAVLGACGPEWAGLSLTMPLKRAVLPLLDEIEPLAREVGAANTVVLSGGRRQGHNTDVAGMIAALAGAGVTGTPDGAPWQATVLILGGGATACSALAAARALGAAQVTVAVRDPARAQDLLAAAARLDVAVTLTGFETPQDGAPEVLISTVPAGAADIYAKRIARGDLVPRHLLDVVYHPWPTALADAARKAGISVAGGVELLLHQAAGQVTLMTGQPAPLPAMRQAGESALRS
ncbi:MAG TPA: shikimate dehydrogenase [Streptosporangiaceae bacterium]